MNQTRRSFHSFPACSEALWPLFKEVNNLRSFLRFQVLYWIIAQCRWGLIARRKTRSSTDLLGKQNHVLQGASDFTHCFSNLVGKEI